MIYSFIYSIKVRLGKIIEKLFIDKIVWVIFVKLVLKLVMKVEVRW